MPLLKKIVINNYTVSWKKMVFKLNRNVRKIFCSTLLVNNYISDRFPSLL